MWNGLRLNDKTPLDELLDAAMRFNGPNELAKDVLKRRTDKHKLAVRLLSDTADKRREGGRYLVDTFHLRGKDILARISHRLREIDRKENAELDDICDVLRKMGRAAVGAVPDLEVAAERVKDDYYAHKDVVELIECLKNLTP